MSSNESLGATLAQSHDERARKSAEELHNLVLSLAIASVGVFFVSLMGRADPPLTAAQRIALLATLVAMSAAAISGLAGWFSEGWRYHYWAAAIQGEDQRSAGQSHSLRDRWLRRERVTAFLLMGLFVLGMLSALIYLALRVLDI